MLDGYKYGLSTTESLEAIIGASPEAFDEAFNTYLEELFGRQLTALLPILEEKNNSDSHTPKPPEYLRKMAEENAGDFYAQLSYGTFSVSYTHLTLPTILLV